MAFIGRLKLFQKLLLFVLPILISSIVLTSIVLSWTNFGFFRQNIDANYGNIIKASAGEISLFMANALRGLEGLAQVLSATKVDQWQQEMALVAFHETAPHFISVSVISPNGDAQVTTRLTRDLVGTDQAETFKRAVSGLSAISGVLLSRENVPYAHVGVPLKHLGGVTSVLWGELDLKSIWDVLKGIRIGETGSVFIINSSGRVIVHLDMDKVINAASAVSSEVLDRLLKAGDMPVEWIEEGDTKHLYCLGYSIPSLDWIIVLSQEDQETYAFMHRNIKWAALLTVLLSLSAVLLLWLPVRRFLTPIHKMHRQVQRIGRGDLDQKVDVESQDEIGDLGVAFNDMTDELKKLIDREVEAAKELAHSKNLAILGAASSKVTHEVGNLLNNIMTGVVRLTSETLTPNQEKVIDLLRKDSERVRAFINNFLQFAKKPELDLQPVSIEGLVREALLVYQAEAESRGISFDLRGFCDLPSIQADVRLLYHVFNNLLKNCLEAMTQPGSVTVEGRTEEGFLEITVRDSGPGIDPKIRERIFEPFFTTKGKKGTGLGLSICKTIVEAHRGTIECRSEVGQGTAFVLRFSVRKWITHVG